MEPIKIHVFQHVPFEGPGAVANWAEARGHIIVGTTHVYKNDSLPDPHGFDMLLIMGGPMGVYENDLYPWLDNERAFIKEVASLDKRIMGICLGAQLIASAFGAHVFKNEKKEIGWFPVEICASQQSHDLLRDLPETLKPLHWHGDTFDLPMGARHLFETEVCSHQGFLLDRHVLGLQFHLEASIESTQALIKYCADELVNGPFIHSKAMIEADLSHKVEMANEALFVLLDNFIKL